VRPAIRVERIPYEEPHEVHLRYSVSNGRQSWCFEYYDEAKVLEVFGEALSGFPRHPQEVFLHEVGSERLEDRWAYYFRFRAFVVTGTGQCALQFRFNNNEPMPDNEQFEFCIRALPGQLDRLGSLYRDFAQLQYKSLEWSLDDGFLA
jgi:hypothetical protein